ncbi:MAG: hypothetical protein AAB472_01910 [Patescibacteria group bacterium]
MNDSELKALENTYKEVSSLRDEFFLHRAQTATALLQSQLQFLQGLATIILAFIAILVATKSFEINLWYFLSGGIAFVLVLYTFTFIRESIDSVDEDMRQIDNKLEIAEKEVISKIKEAIRVNNYNVMSNYAKDRIEALQVEMDLSYAGEISMFLFFSSLLFCIIAILKSYQIFSLIDQNQVCIVIGVLSTAILFSANWNLKLTRSISRLLQIKLWA